MPISVGLERKLKVTKAKELTGSLKGGLGCLIEIDIRDQAIGLAKHELEDKKLSEKEKLK